MADTAPKPASPRIPTKRLLGVAAGLGVLALGVYLAIPPTTVTHLDGSFGTPTAVEHVQTGVMTFALSLPLLAALLGALVALVPRGGLAYRERFVRTVLMILILVYGLAAAMGTLNLILLAAG